MVGGTAGSGCGAAERLQRREPVRSAISRASVVLPEPVTPYTRMRLITARSYGSRFARRPVGRSVRARPASACPYGRTTRFPDLSYSRRTTTHPRWRLALRTTGTRRYVMSVWRDPGRVPGEGRTVGQRRLWRARRVRDDVHPAVRRDGRSDLVRAPVGAQTRCGPREGTRLAGSMNRRAEARARATGPVVRR